MSGNDCQRWTLDCILSGDMALRIEKAFGVRMDTLMRMQSAYDIAQTRKREKLIRVRRIVQVADVHA